MRYLVLALVVSACGTSTVIDAKQYAKTCSAPTDCAAIYAGDICAVCRCPNEAIASSSMVVYSADRNAAEQRCTDRNELKLIDCGCTRSTPTTCTNGTCQLAAQ